MPYNRRRFSRDAAGNDLCDPHEANYFVEETVSDDDKTVLQKTVTEYKRRGPKPTYFRDEKNVLWSVRSEGEREKYLALMERHGKETG